MSAIQEIFWTRLSGNSAITARVDATNPRIFPGPDNVIQGDRGKRPRIEYAVLSEEETTDNDDGPTGRVVSRVRVDCRDSTAELARSLAVLVRKSYNAGGPLNGLYGTVGAWTVQHCFKVDGSDEIDFDEVNGRTVSLEFEIAYNSEA